jgi:ethanolamine ammonia-lyase small subunit
METIFHTPDPWTGLRTLTEARIALGRTGGSLPTAEVLDFRLAHAAARDAVLTPFDPTALAEEILTLGTGVFTVTSAAANRAQYLQRPDSGRQLSAGSRAALTDFAAGRPPVDLVVIAADGLSTQAVRQIVPLLRGLLPALQAAGWELAPVIVASQARVALQDEIGNLLQARLSLILLGERPGLGSADSLGAYFTWDPRPGRHDAERNCLSNIRAAGLPPAAAAVRLFHLLTESRRRGLSGTSLKDETPPPGLQHRRD